VNKSINVFREKASGNPIPMWNTLRDEF